jgi:hypothetical protein
MHPRDGAGADEIDDQRMAPTPYELVHRLMRIVGRRPAQMLAGS